jgi:hypothetical protein
MKKSYFLLLFAIIIISEISGQVIISNDNSVPDPSAILELKSTDKGLLPPRMTLSQRSGIIDPAEGLMIYCTNCGQDGTPVLSVYMTGAWRNLSGCTPPASPSPAIHIACPTQITWTWHPVPGAEGYLWSSSEDGAMLDLGTDTSRIETGLVSNTVYTWYVWAYNACGLSAARELTLSTSPDAINAPLAGANIPSSHQITWKWNNVDEALGYKWNTVNSYNTALDVGLDTAFTENSLACETPYTRYVWAYLDCIVSEASSLTDTTISDTVLAPVAAVHIPASTQVTWKWHAVTNATGYKWNTTNNIGTATNVGTDTSYTQTGLVCETEYICYVWAYSSCSESGSTSMSQFTSSCGTCVVPITITHVAGNVAPVDKVTTYNLVTNVPGEPSKCWITSNLGSDHQAVAKDDNTEASAGWYWQFNRIQGYKHDGTDRTPNSAWVTSINETSNWMAANDPCTIELGSLWRIPTSTEWTNVDGIGGWTDWNDPWNSLLKLHAAGYLYYTTGALNYRGSDGRYWSSVQANTSQSNCLYFISTSSQISSYPKTFGFTVRCVKDQ